MFQTIGQLRLPLNVQIWKESILLLISLSFFKFFSEPAFKEIHKDGKYTEEAKKIGLSPVCFPICDH